MKPEMIEKSICVRNKGSFSGRELYGPNCDVSLMVSELWRGSRKKANFLFEDLMSFANHGWKIYYIGKKSSNLHLIGAEYLGEHQPKFEE